MRVVEGRKQTTYLCSSGYCEPRCVCACSNRGSRWNGASLGPSIGKYMDLPITIPENAAVANAIGAALALSTIELTVHVDTKRRLTRYS